MLTGLYAALCALLVFVLSLRIALLRRRLRVGIGDGGDAGLARAIRAQANAIEYIPLLLVMLLIAENNGASEVFVHVCGAGLVLARVLHAVGLSGSAGVSFGRFWGILLTWGVLLALGLQLIWGYIAALSAA
ncbi:MAPEG family protein [Silanimonas lenta]|uniref:MAPEG family protein n=1 Tax=Silanimonas lenta TaxID=265429 RepID=UPI0004090536|nr:MAPEG family protein [Silanimonas lenta]